MTTIELDDDLVAEIEHLAAIEHKPVKQMVNEYLRELINYYHDALIADTAISRIESGDDKLISWGDIQAELHASFKESADDYLDTCAKVGK